MAVFVPSALAAARLDAHGHLMAQKSADSMLKASHKRTLLRPDVLLSSKGRPQETHLLDIDEIKDLGELDPPKLSL